MSVQRIDGVLNLFALVASVPILVELRQDFLQLHPRSCLDAVAVGDLVFLLCRVLHHCEQCVALRTGSIHRVDGCPPLLHVGYRFLPLIRRKLCHTERHVLCALCVQPAINRVQILVHGSCQLQLQIVRHLCAGCQHVVRLLRRGLHFVVVEDSRLCLLSGVFIQPAQHLLLRLVVRRLEHITRDQFLQPASDGAAPCLVVDLLLIGRELAVFAVNADAARRIGRNRLCEPAFVKRRERFVRRLIRLHAPVVHGIADLALQLRAAQALHLVFVRRGQRIVVCRRKFRRGPAHRAEQIRLQVVDRDARQVCGRCSRQVFDAADNVTAVPVQVFAQASAVLHDVRCVLQHIQTVLPLLHDGLHNVGQLLQARRVDAVPLVARNDVADDVRKFFSVGDDTSQVSHQPQRHFLCHASCCKIPVLVAVRLALALPEVHQELDALRPDVPADGCQERNAQTALGLVVILRVADSLVVFRLTGTLPQRIVGLRAVRLEHRKRPRHRILALAQRTLVHLVRGGLASSHRFVEYFCNLLIERAASAVDLLLVSGLQLRELSSYLVFRPRPQHARGPAVHGGDRSAAEDKVRELVCLCPVRIFLQLLGLRRGIAQRSPVQLLCVLLNQAPVDALYLSRRREVLEVQPRTRQWNRTQLLKDDGWVCPEHGADVIAEDFFCAHAHAVARACRAALQRLHQVLDVLQTLIAPVVGDDIRHGVFPLAPV